MRKLDLFKVAPATLLIALILSGCSEKSECEIPARHVHKFIRPFSNGITIERFVEDEHLWLWGGYEWTDEYIEVTKTDAEVFKLLSNSGLFYGEDNWEYLYNEMASHHDYLMFYYEYTTKRTVRIEDEDGNVKETEEVTYHDGWTDNPHYEHNTGETRLYHHRYYGFRVIYVNGKFKLEKSPEVDDIRDVIDEYPYFSENDISEVFTVFHFSRYQLPSLNVNDFDTYEQPNLANPNLAQGDARVRQNKYTK